MKTKTREAFDSYASRIAELNKTATTEKAFTVQPTIQQRMETKIQESDEFLKMINVIGVDQMQGERVSVGVSGPIAKRTDTSKNDRQTSDVSTLEAMRYECVSTEFDTCLTWAKLDAWAHLPDFQLKANAVILRQHSLDRLSIGFNGTHAATETSLVENPELQDVNKGWLQLYREHAAARVLSEGDKAPGELRVGPGGDYENLDAMIFDAVSELIDPWHRASPDLKVIAGRDLLPIKYFAMAQEHGSTPSEMLALQNSMMGNARFGRVQPIRVGPMPEGKLFITMPQNLSIYWQRGSRRRYLIDNPKRNRIEDYQSSNDAYVVEDFGAGCLLENIVFGDWR